MKVKNNKGFTLIELIVVIAIIAVLAVVLAPQYIQYVERGRESNDIQITQNLMDAASIVAASNTVPVNDYRIEWDTDNGGRVIVKSINLIGAFDSGYEDSIAMRTELEKIINLDNLVPQSVNAKSLDFNFIVEMSDGEVYYESTGADDVWVEMGVSNYK